MDINNTLDNNFTAINKLETDYRAEVVAAGMIEAGMEADKILIVRKEGDKRHVSKDISKIEKGFSKEDLMEYLYIYTNRTSIYDAIPENIFHQPFNTAKKKTQEDIIDEIKKHRQEEFYARKYFQPFEMAIDQILTDAQIYEQKFNKKNFHSNLKDLFACHWPMLKLLNLKQAVYFIRIIPWIYRLSTDFKVMGQLMGIILDAPVKIELGELSKIQTNLTRKVTSKHWKLGVNTTIGNSFVDGYRDINITIGPINPEQMKLFLEGLKNDLILQQLIGMMLPADCQKVITYKTQKEHAKFRLSDSTHRTYLGINTKL